MIFTLQSPVLNNMNVGIYKPRGIDPRNIRDAMRWCVEVVLMFHVFLICSRVLFELHLHKLQHPRALCGLPITTLPILTAALSNIVLYNFRHSWRFLLLGLPPTVQVLLCALVGILIKAAVKFPHFFVGHRIDMMMRVRDATTTTTTYFLTVRVVTTAILSALVRDVFQLQHLALLLTLQSCIALEWKIIVPPMAIVVIFDVGSSLLRRNDSSPLLSSCDVVPINSKLRQEIESTARHHGMLPKGWSASSLCCVNVGVISSSSFSSSSRSCSEYAAAVGSKVILSSAALCCDDVESVVAIALHEMAHVRRKHVDEDNWWRAAVQIVRASAVVIVALIHEEWMSIHPVVAYLCTRSLVVHPLFNLFGNYFLNGIGQEQELEADAAAVTCGYGAGLLRALREDTQQKSHRMSSRRRVHSRYARWYMDHPSLEVRRSKVMEQIAQMKTRNQKKTKFSRSRIL